MKNLIIIFFILTSIKVFGQTIDGKVIDGVREEIIPGAGVELQDSSGKIKTRQYADMEGRFQFRNVCAGLYSIKVFFIGYEDTTFKNIKIAGDTRLEFDIHRFCQYDASAKDKTCPACHTKDKVIPIVYGLMVSTKGESNAEGKTFKSGGCNITMCDPHWYCKRDKIEF